MTNTNNYIGQPHDVTRGRIREALVNYTPPYHDAIEGTIEALPNTSFVIFNGPCGEEILGMTEKKGAQLFASGYESSCKKWERMLKNRRTLLEFYQELIKEKTKLELVGNRESPRYEFLCDFLEMAALFHYYQNQHVSAARDRSACQLKERHPGRVEVVDVDYLVADFATDEVLPLQKDGKRVLVPIKRAITSDIVGQIRFDPDAQVANPVWNRRGYERGENLDVAGLVGGNIVANSRHIFIGMNAYEEEIVKSGELIAREKVRRMSQGAKIHAYRDFTTYEHIDLLAMPVKDDMLFVGDPTGTSNTLRRAGLLSAEDEEINRPYMEFFRAMTGQLNKSGLRAVSVPFWIARSDAVDYMMTYCNILQEQDRFYVPQRSENISPRLAQIGSVLDDKFSNLASRYKSVTQVHGFYFPSCWETAGLRCLVNVTWRE